MTKLKERMEAMYKDKMINITKTLNTACEKNENVYALAQEILPTGYIVKETTTSVEVFESIEDSGLSEDDIYSLCGDGSTGRIAIDDVEIFIIN